MLNIHYSCPTCGIKRATVTIPYRDPKVDVITWMHESVLPALMEHHNRVAPFCKKPEELTDLMIPISGARYVGGPPIN